ncbi:hypothetical protein QNH86_28935, partial [Klebsiella pneumoniae]
CVKETAQKVIVSEAGASVYSASELAAQEFPDLDVSLRARSPSPAVCRIPWPCSLYTSDAADEKASGGPGGTRINNTKQI